MTTKKQYREELQSTPDHVAVIEMLRVIARLIGRGAAEGMIQEFVDTEPEGTLEDRKVFAEAVRELIFPGCNN